MSTNIVEDIQKNLAYPPLHKVDPNIQEINDKFGQSSVEKLAQAAIPAVLTGFYKLSRTDEGCQKILDGAKSEDWLAILFEGKEDEAVEKVAEYAEVKPGEANQYMEKIATEAVKLIKNSSAKDAGCEKIKAYMDSQRHHILVYLPAVLNLGDLLNDEGLDDRTNKMEGPVSNVMHKIENTLSRGGDH